MNNEKKQEFTARITSANRSELVVILYDMIHTYIEDAEKFFANNEKESCVEELKKARECVKELIFALDMKYEISSQLSKLYLFANRSLTKCIFKYDEELLQSVKRIMDKLGEGFREVAREDNSPVLMANAQEIYAGLTYGKTSLNENLADEGASRGFFV